MVNKMNKLILASAAVLLSVGGALAQPASVAVAPQYNDQGLLPSDVAGAKSTAASATISAPHVVAPSYDDRGNLKTDGIAGTTGTFSASSPAAGSVIVAPSYNDQGKLPTDR